MAYNFKNVYFFDYGYGVRGGAIFCINLAKYLLDYTDLNVRVIDFPDGYIPENINDDRVTIVEYHAEDEYWDIEDNSIIFVAMDRVYLLKKILKKHKNIRVLTILWETNIHWPTLFFKNQKQKLGLYLDEKDGLVFLDEGCRKALNRQFKHNFKKSYLPIYLSQDNSAPAPEIINPQQLNFGWLGRISDMKILSLLNFVEQLYHLPDEREKIIHIIGSGLNEGILYEACQKYTDRIRFIFCGRLTGDALDDYISSNIDVLYAMGTSILNGCKLKIPVIAAHEAERPYNLDAFHWFYNVSGYQLGQPANLNDMDPNYLHLRDMVDLVFNQNRKVEIGNNCYNYGFKTHGNFEVLGQQFLTALQNTTANYSHVINILGDVPLNAMFRKQYKIFGIIFSEVSTCASSYKLKFLGVNIFKIKGRAPYELLNYYFFGIKFFTVEKKNAYDYPNITDKSLK